MRSRKGVALVVVNPNNPTGQFLTKEEWAGLTAIVLSGNRQRSSTSRMCAGRSNSWNPATTREPSRRRLNETRFR